MLIDVSMEEARGMPDDAIMDLVRHARSLKADRHAEAASAAPDAESGESGWYRKPGLFKGQISMSDDFDAPLDDFEDYM